MKVRNMARCALFTALFCLCAWIGIPFGDMTVTLQTFALFLTLGLLGGRLGSLVCLVYLLLGCAGLPVFSGFRGGIGVLMGPNGGYIWGFLAASVVYWAITGALKSRSAIRWAAMGAALGVCYGVGTLWFALVWLRGTGALSLGLILGKCVAPYVLPDLLKLGLAMTLTRKLEKSIKPFPGP